jgi:DNA mismatch repair protein MutL
MSNEPVIQLLPDHIINKIAAGEVVDRPASVVKELMENAIDAGATQIEVAVVDGGLKKISVADNGCGMSRDNALLAIERHATSKIRHVDDIEKVATLGFRGEALAAIASVSRFALLTRRADDVQGTEIRINGGRVEDVLDAGCPPGTEFIVRNLFYNVPARRKFMKAPATELQQVRQIFMLYAMGRPDIGLRLVADERELYRLDADSQLEDRIHQLYGSAIMRDLVAVDAEIAGMRVHGLVSHPRLHRSDRNEQYMFINGRPASAPVLGFALNEVYQEWLPRGRHPLVFLFLSLPPGDVDVNVHPTKKEVRFRQSSLVRDAMMQALRKALAPGSSVPVSAPPVRTGVDIVGLKPIEEMLRVPDLPVLPAFEYPGKKKDMAPAYEGATVSAAASTGLSAGHTPEPSTRTFSAEPPWHWCRVLGQIAGYFVVLETDEGMMLMDPQAAHERVLYERMMAGLRKKSIPTQGLLVPETIQLPPVKAEIIRRHAAELRALGFGLSEFGGDTFILDALPGAMGECAGTNLLLDIATDLETLGKHITGAEVLREHVVKAAAGAAVRTTQQLTREELERLITDLSVTDLPYTSPRGRPTLVFTSVQEMKKKFGR